MAGRRVGYWISKKVGTLFVEDLNYTHIDRHVLIAAGLQSTQNDVRSISKDKVNKVGMTFPNPSTSNNGKGTLSTQSYDEVILKSFSHSQDAKEFVGEPVPRYPKKCSDLVLQGSNNTVIVMTHEGEVNTGTIKIAAGRKTIPNKIQNIRSRSASNFQHEEIDKLALLRGELPDFKEGTIDGNEAASLIITELDGGSIRLGNAAGAYIELKSSGDICIVPSNQGVIKLGGEDANKAMVSNMGTNTAGNVVGTPFATSMGGAVGAPGFGGFASKILVK